MLRKPAAPIAATLTAALLVALVAIPGCSQAERDDTGRLKVAVSIQPQQWILERIGGDRVEVLVVVPPTADPHTFTPDDATVTRIVQCAAYFRMRMPLESQGQWFNAIASTKKVRIFDMQQGMPFLDMPAHHHHHHEHDHDHDHTDHDHHDHDDHAMMSGDPHTWTDPLLLKQQASTVAAALKQLDPAHAATYDANLGELHQQLDALHADLTSILAPVKGKAFVVFHPSWGYFAKRYDLEQIAVEHEGATPSDQELASLIRKAKQAGAKTVFVQPQINAQAASTIAKALGGADARPVMIDPLAPDLADNLRKVARAIAAQHASQVN